MLTILFAQDNTSVGELCKNGLESEGHRVILARRGADAIALVKRAPPDAVIVDLSNGTGGGLETVEPIRAIAPGIPIILLTATDEECLTQGRSGLVTARVKRSDDATEMKREIVKALSLLEAKEPAAGDRAAPVTVNAAFLQEIKEDYLELQQLLVEIRGALARPDSLGELWKRFVTLLGELRGGLATYFRLEEMYGYFENPVSAAGRLGRSAQTLRRQHQRLYSEICAICEQAQQRLDRTAGASAPRKIVQRFAAFCDRLREHEGREDDLIFQAFSEGTSQGVPRAVAR